MSTVLLLASRPPSIGVLISGLLFICCLALALVFFIASGVLFAQKQRKPAGICVRLAFLFTILWLVLYLYAAVK